jgi:hypothetical protein
VCNRTDPCAAALSPKSNAWVPRFGTGGVFAQHIGKNAHLSRAFTVESSRDVTSTARNVRAERGLQRLPATTLNAELAEPAEKTGVVLRVLRVLR